MNKHTSCTATIEISPAFTLIRFASIFKTDFILHVSDTEMGRDDLQHPSTRTGLSVISYVYKLECIVSTLDENAVVKSTVYLINFTVADYVFKNFKILQRSFQV